MFVDRFDRRQILVSTNVARGLLFLPWCFWHDLLLVIYLMTPRSSTLTAFFGPAESAMIPMIVAGAS